MGSNPFAIAPKKVSKPRIPKLPKDGVTDISKPSDFIETIAWHYWDTWFKRKVPKGDGKGKREYDKLCKIIPDIKKK